MKRKVSLIFVAVLTLLVMTIGTLGITVNAADSSTTEYTITYHLDGGTNAIKNPDVYTSEDVITLQPAAKDGYIFDGWYLNASKTNRITEISGMEGNINLYAKFSPKSYTATFNDEIKLTVSVPGFEDKIYYVPYGTSIDPYSYSFMSTYLPSNKNSASTSYSNDPKFSGWYILNSDGTKTKISASLTVNTDTTIVCDFKKSIDTIIKNYELRYGTYTGERGVGLDGYLLVPTLSNGKVTITFDLPPFSGTGGYNYIETYIRNWTTGKLYHSVGQRTQLYETITINANPGDVIQIKVTGSSTNGRVTITAPGRMTAPLVSKKSSQATVYYDNMVDVPQPSSREGYVFVGWEDKNGNIFDGSKWTYLESMTFVPKYQPRKYSIRYELDGGVNNISNPSNYTIEDTITLQAPSKKGYTFEGWFSDKALTTPVTKISNSTGDLTLYAKYSVNTYDLYLDGAGGSFSPKVVFVSEGQIIRTEYLGENDSIKAYRPDQKEGYIFGGWYTDETLKSAFKFTGTISDDITLYAKWIECDSDIIYPETIENFNVTINGKTEKYYAFVPLNDGTVKVTSDSDNLDLYGILYNSTKGILTQADDISDSDLDFSFSYKVKANQLYYICVKGNTASTKGDAVININFTGGTVISGTTYSNREIEVTYGSNFSLPDLPVKEGYVFLGWYDETDTQVTNGKWEFISNKILTAKWREKTPHTITFKDENGEVLAVQDYLYGDIITPPEFPVKKADQTYTYDAKWDHDYSGICVGDVTYTVVYTPVYIDYSIVFKDADGTVLSSKTYHYGDAVTAPQTPTKAADSTYTYTFAGWDKSVISCAGNATYTATYKATYIDYTVVFKDHDGEVISTKTYHYGDAITVPTNPERTADNTYTYTFAGWDKSVVSCAGNAIYTATYTPTYIEYNVVFKDYNGKVLSRNNYHYGDAISIPSDPTRAADSTYTYVFAGWDISLTSTCSGSVTYTATYTPTYIEYTVVFKDYDGEIISTKTYHYGDEVTAPTDPTRETDVIGSYTFKSWDKAVVACAGNATYIATYDIAYTDYTVIFKNYNGDVLSTNTYHYGDTVVVPSAPSKPADETYTYAFIGWDNTVTKCEGNATYTAKFAPTNVEYTVVFKDENGTVLSTKTYYYGAEVVVPNAPSKAADNTYTYTFAGWDKEVVDCVADATYTATYTPVYINYTVTFTDYDGSTIKTVTYHYGDTIEAIANPTRASDETYTYTFKSWDKALGTCKGNTTFKAIYTPTYIDYTVIFKNEDGTVLSRNTYHYGDAITAPATPTKAADNTYTYTFKGWDQAVVNCAGNATYTATYNANYIDYTVTFKNADGTVLSTKTYHYGASVTAPKTPTKAADNTYTYSFKDWDKEVVDCAGNATYIATYNANYIDYTVIFKNADGKVLSTKTYHYGEKVTEPDTPTKAADNTYTYTFKAWDKNVVDCAGDVTYTATYDATYIDYTVTFKNEDGRVLSSKTYHYGDVVTAPTPPTKAADNTYTYTFAGWDKAVVACDGDKVYTATYTSAYIEYTVVFKDWNGNVISSKEYHYGQAVTKPSNPTRAADNTYTYTFAGWDKTVTACTESVVYTATYSSTYIEYEVVFKNYDGTILSTNKYHYGDTVAVPEAPTKPADKNCTYGFAGWDSEVTACLGNKTYTATFNPTNVEYTVVFKDYNGNVISSKTYHFGDEIVVPDNPSRNADNKFTYAFKNWGKTVVETCVGDAEYTAVYDATYIEYNIRFLDWDGSLIQTVKYHYGDTITAIADPERESDETYTYTFLSWNKALGTCTGNASFTAQYESTFINYTVVFKDYDGSVISRKTYHFGDTITIPADPVRASDDTYSYTFKNWGNISTSCKGNKEYMAVYKEEYIDYTVTFKDHDGSVISTQTYHFGDDVTAPKNPTRSADNTYTYSFAGWNKNVVACDGEATYTATYTPTFIDYTVEFKDYDGTVISTKTYHYGDAITVPVAPTRESDVIGSYTFKAWDSTVVNCAGNVTYTATYEITYIDYTVIFKNEDGTVLSTNTYHYGDEVTVPTTPTKASDNTYTYTFKAWDTEVAACAGNATYTATYDSAYIDYTVTFKNEDGTVLSTNTYHYGDDVIAPADPAKESDGEYVYTFNGWDKGIVACDGDAVYIATYTSTKIEESETTETTESETIETTESETTETTESETTETPESETAETSESETTETIESETTETTEPETTEATESETIETIESETTETIESETTETIESETTETTEPETIETAEVETNGQMDNKPGCGGSISGSSIVFVALIGLGALQLTKKKK